MPLNQAPPSKKTETNCKLLYSNDLQPPSGSDKIFQLEKQLAEIFVPRTDLRYAVDKRQWKEPSYLYSQRSVQNQQYEDSWSD